MDPTIPHQISSSGFYTASKLCREWRGLEINSEETFSLVFTFMNITYMCVRVF
jgi:hypothetical protein